MLRITAAVYLPFALQQLINANEKLKTENARSIVAAMNPFRHNRSLLCARTLRGFTLVELLVVIAVIAILASLLLPTLNKGKLKAYGITCMNSHRQLVIAWRMYSDDNRDLLLYASELPWVPSSYDAAWVTGTLDFDENKPTNWDPALTIHKSPMWPYTGKNLAVWKCPADTSYVTVNGEKKPRVRSMSMNVFMGGWAGTHGGWPWQEYRIHKKQSDLASTGPANLFVFLDMRQDSIDMGNFATSMFGWPDQPARYSFFDLPGFMHHYACGFSFADGHAEIRRWRDSRTMPPLKPEGTIYDGFSSPNNPDIEWLQARTTRPY